MSIVYPLMIIAIGAVMSFQPLVNVQLAKHVSSPIWVSFISFVVGAILLLIAGLIANNGKFMTVEIKELKWWMILSRFLGAMYVTASIYLVPLVGIATMASLTVAGSFIMAAFLSHYGILADMPHPISLQKAIGMIVLAIGVIIIVKAK